MTTTSFNQIVDSYVACWNERDAQLRHKLIADLWAEDAQYYNRLFVCSGRDMVEAAISTSHLENFAKGFSFRSQGDAYGHHNGVRFGWVMVSTQTGEVDTFGQEFIIFDEHGKITVDYQFGLRPPAI